VTVVDEIDGKQLKVFGNGVNIDISVAGILSFVDALNKLDYIKQRNHIGEKIEAQL